MESDGNRSDISKFIRARFTERYITPMKVTNKETKSGFTIMAVCCLMIEALESFSKGWVDSRNKSQSAFCNFFDQNSQFVFIRGHSEEFYQHVRCGILHQAETTGGWCIRRDGPIFDRETKLINATLFLDEVEKALNQYCNDLETQPWDAKIWKNLRHKMKALCKNTELS